MQPIVRNEAGADTTPYSKNAGTPQSKVSNLVGDSAEATSLSVADRLEDTWGSGLSLLANLPARYPA
jgi:hypothetical protein